MPVRLLMAAVLITSACGGPQFIDDPQDAVARLSGVVCGEEVVATAAVIRDELMVTAAHTVAGADGPLLITFADGESFQASVVGFDRHRDVAFLATPGMHRLPIRMGDPTGDDRGSVLRLSSQLDPESVSYEAAELVVAVGHDIFDDPSEVRRANVRIDATVGPGFSGAPVLDEEGTLTGIVSARSRATSLVYAVATSEIRLAFAETDLATPARNDRCARG